MDVTIPYIVLTLISPFFFFYYLIQAIYETVRQAKRDEERGKTGTRIKFTGTMKVACVWLALFLATMYLTLAFIVEKCL